MQFSKPQLVLVLTIPDPITAFTDPLFPTAGSLTGACLYGAMLHSSLDASGRTLNLNALTTLLLPRLVGSHTGVPLPAHAAETCFQRTHPSLPCRSKPVHTAALIFTVMKTKTPTPASQNYNYPHMHTPEEGDVSSHPQILPGNTQRSHGTNRPLAITTSVEFSRLLIPSTTSLCQYSHIKTQAETDDLQTNCRTSRMQLKCAFP